MRIRAKLAPHIDDLRNPGVVHIEDLETDAILAGNIKDGNVTQSKLAPSGATAATLVNKAISDPGNGAAIPVTTSGCIDMTIGAGAETNTLAIPTFLGQDLLIVAGTIGAGSRAITCAQAINQAGNTVMTFGQASDFISLVAIKIGGAFRWRVQANDGVALS